MSLRLPQSSDDGARAAPPTWAEAFTQYHSSLSVRFHPAKGQQSAAAAAGAAAASQPGDVRHLPDEQAKKREAKQAEGWSTGEAAGARASAAPPQLPGEGTQ